ncbi:HepT-like ribonuclease domain-containing protein [Microlunatus elymi]|nr:HepT-like ribonuclease domain-containing protein [Microlunatus elymi]
MRKLIVHGYWDIDVETLVTTAADHLPQMIARIEDVITDLQESEEPEPSG